MTDDVMHPAQYYTKYINKATAQSIETWQANTCSSMGNTPMALKNYVPIATYSFPVPTHLISTWQ